MSEYWKSTPKYWCKFCSIYVRDTKLERANHEATGKHQGAIKRSLRELHRNHEQEEKSKERAQREIDRLNGVVSQSKAGDGFRKPGSSSGGGASSVQDERQRQLEQLAELGVNIPTQLRPELALAGEWQVTSTRVIKDPEEGGDSGRAAGVRKREREQTEEEKEAEEAVQGLFKKPKKWGRDSRTIATEEDVELEQLLSGSLVKAVKEEVKEEDIKTEEPESKLEFKLKQEESTTDGGMATAVKTEEKDAPPLIKHESTGGVGGLLDLPDAQEEEKKPPGDAAPAVVFKKRKAKNIRQK